jgi:hypothetical protein
MPSLVDWDCVIPAVGYFRELALAINTRVPLTNIIWGSPQGSRGFTSVSEEGSA